MDENGHLSSASTRMKSLAIAVTDLQLTYPEKSLRLRVKTRHSILWEKLEDRSQIDTFRRFYEPYFLYLLICGKVPKS